MYKFLIAFALSLLLTCSSEPTRDASPSGDNVVITPDPALAAAKGLGKRETIDAAKHLEESLPMCETIYKDLKKYVQANPNGVPCLTKCLPTYDSLMMEVKRYADLLMTSASVDFQLTVDMESYLQCEACLTEAPKIDKNIATGATWFQKFFNEALAEVKLHNMKVTGKKA